MLAGVLPARGGGQAAVFYSPVFIALLSALGIALIVCAVRRRPSRRQVGFHLTHLSVALILLGAFLGFAFGERTQLAVPVAADHETRELPLADGGSAGLPFGLSVTDFEVLYYPPDYVLYRPSGEAGYEFVRRVRLPAEGTLDLGEAGSIAVEDLKDDAGEWLPERALAGGRVLRRAAAMPRRYAAALRISDPGGAVRREELAVNHPVEHGGWRFYLMSYDEDAARYVVLSARRDPGRRLVIAGIWALMAGVAIMCFRRRGAARGTD